MQRHHLAPALLTTLVLTACGGPDQPAPTSAPPPLTSSSAAPTTSTEPPPPPRTLPQAADGTDLRACADGNCEVEAVAPVDFPLDPKLTKIRKFTLNEVTATGAHFTAQASNGNKYEGTVLVTGNALSKVVFDNRLRVSTIGVDKGVAVIRLALER